MANTNGYLAAPVGRLTPLELIRRFILAGSGE